MRKLFDSLTKVSNFLYTPNDFVQNNRTFHPISFYSQPMQNLRLRRLTLWLPLTIACAALLYCVPAFSQDAAAAAAAAPAEAPKKTLLDYWTLGGWAMWPLGLLSVMAVTLTVYNFLQLTKAKFVPPTLKGSYLNFMTEVRVRSAIEHTAASPSYFGRMMAGSLPFIDATDEETLGRENVENAMADFASKENPSYMMWVAYFSTIAGAAPMVGLLGTVSGMISAFEALNASGGADTAQMSNSISEALITTATGLIIAIPCLFCFVYFKNTLNGLVADAQRTAEEGLNAAIATVRADQLLAKVPEGIAEV